MKRAALYARVSTDRQEREETIESQLQQLRAMAAEKGLLLLDRHIYTDDGFSGNELARPGLDRLRDDARDGLLDVVLIHCPDRLARRYAYQVVIIEELQKYGCEVYFLNRPIADTPEDQMLLAMQGVIAEYERAKILERTRRGRLYKARMGVLNIGCVPYGYRRIPKQGAQQQVQVEIVAEQAEIVRKIFHLVAQEGFSIHAVTKRLNEMQIPAPRGGNHWDRGTVGQILRKRAYIGEFCCNRLMAVEPKNPIPGVYRRRRKCSFRIRPPEEWIIMPVPAIIEREVFNSVAERLAHNKQFALRHTDPLRQHLLRCLVRCGNCGYSMVGVTGTNQNRIYRYYKCRKHWMPHQYSDGIQCPTPSIQAPLLDEIVWSDLCNLLSDPQRIVRYAGLDGETNNGALREEANRLSYEITNCERQLQRLLDAYQHGALDVDELLCRRKSLVERKDTLAGELERTQRTLDDAGVRSAIRSRLPEVVRDVQAGLDAADFETRQKIVRLLIDRVVVMSNLDVEVHYHLPLSGIHERKLPKGGDSSDDLPGEASQKIHGRVSGKFQLCPQSRTTPPLLRPARLLERTSRPP